MFVEQGLEGRVDAIGKVLLDAAALIERYGWMTGGMGNTAKGFCWRGAIRYVCGLMHLRDEAERRLAAHLGVFNPTDIERWNDQVAQSKEQVIAALRAAASVQNSICPVRVAYPETYFYLHPTTLPPVTVMIKHLEPEPAL